MATEQITIAGRTFTVPTPFAEGHVLNANEASALNQTFHENIRNNTAKKIKEIEDQEQAKAVVDDYADGYQFGVRSGGGGFRGDPVMTEAMSIAREAVRRGLQKGWLRSHRREEGSGHEGYGTRQAGPPEASRVDGPRQDPRRAVQGNRRRSRSRRGCVELTGSLRAPRSLRGGYGLQRFSLLPTAL